MDTTPKYIKQCEKAEEIQRLWEKQDGDYYYEELKEKQTGGYKQGTHIFCYGCQYEMSSHQITKNTEKFIWLPTQDQLQKMIEYNFSEQGFSSGWGFAYTHIDDMFCAFWEWREKEIKAQGRGRLPDESITAEQLWLAFVMHEKFDTHWDNEKEEWVK